jgi:hypothetical protein
MYNCDTDIKTHKKKGSKQSERLLKALQPSFFRLDERSIADLIESTNKLSGQINFYDENNVLSRRWDTFFQWETTSILAQISQIDINSLIKDFQLKKRELLFIKDLPDQKDLVLPFFDSILNLTDDLIKKTTHLPGDFEMKNYFTSTQSNLKLLINTVLQELSTSSNLVFTLQHHLFNKKVQNIFGLLQQWKNKSEAELYKNLQSYPKHSPQYALYLAFLKLFGFAQKNLNTFTARHLDFYYNKILNLYPEDVQPDHVHLCIEPQKNAPVFSINKGSIFLGGKDPEGRKKYYQSTADLAVNQSKIGSIFGISIQDGKFYFQDSTELNATGEYWKSFPSKNQFNDIGFALATPLLYLKGGNRSISLSFRNSRGRNVNVHPDHFNFYLTGEEGWHLADADFEGGSTILNISSEEKAVIPFDHEIHPGIFFSTPFPILKITPKSGFSVNANFTSVNLSISVSNYKRFKLYSNAGEIDHSQSFEPYGPVPKKGDSLIFTCKEFFQKKNARGTFSISTDATDSNLEMKPISRFTLLKNGSWLRGNLLDSNHQFTNQSLIDFDFSEERPISSKDASGYARFILNSDAYSANKYLEDYINAAKADGSGSLPYVPNILDFSLSYTVDANFSISDSNLGKNFGCYQIYPKGFSIIEGDKMQMLPPITNEGEMYVGFKDIEGGNALSLLFQVADGTANPRQESIDLTWSYLHGKKWVKFESKDINDSTNGLTQSGIVNLNCPLHLKLAQQTQWPSDQWWIKIEAKEKTDAVCDLLGVHNHALKATLADYESSGLEFMEHTEAGTISKPLFSNNKIKAIEQPYASFSGKPKENQHQFYQRTSERLRHKERAITIWDFERIVLENFPEVHQVKCLNHHRYDSKALDNSSAGYVTLIPVAQTTHSNKPLVGLDTMKRIQEILKSKASPHLRLAVKAPKLEKLKLRFNVNFKEKPGSDINLYKKELQDSINAFLSPWAYKQTVTVNFQKPLEKSSLVHLIEKQDYVDFISDFKVDHIILEDTSDDVSQIMTDIDKIIPKTVYSLFVPDTHEIISLTTECCS